MELSKKETNYEHEHLENTLHVIRTKISELGQEFYDKEEKIQEFKELIWDSKHDMDPTEMRFMMAESDSEVLKMERKSKYFQNIEDCNSSLHQTTTSPLTAEPIKVLHD